MKLTKQCSLRRPSGSRLLTRLPAEPAVSGRCLTLEAADGRKIPNLVVETVCALALPLALIREHERDWTKSTDYVRGQRRK